MAAHDDFQQAFARPTWNGRIGDQSGRPYLSTVRAAQDAVAQLVPNVYEVDIDNLPLRPDLLHYTSDGEIELGDLFAYGVINMTIAVPQPASIGMLVVAGSESLESFVNTRIKD